MENIDNAWLVEKMKLYQLNNRELGKFLNIGEHQISKWVNGRIELGKQTKNHLYHFFRCLELENELKKLKTT